MPSLKLYERSSAPAIDIATQQHLGVRLRVTCGLDATLPAHLRTLARELARVLGEGDKEDFEADLMRSLPSLRAFAISLSGSHHRADDLVQETMLKALRNFDKFEPGTNLLGWLFTILRNQFNTEYRKRSREVEDPEGVFVGNLSVPPEQPDRVDHADLCAALAKMRVEQREVLIMIGAEGKSYEEMATLCGVPIGTIKSRVNRARARLGELLEVD